jgi:MerR family copper efflux transcriptional regulator
MNIGEAAQASGLTAKTIRYYEQIELVSVPARNLNGYRLYDEGAVEELRFVHRARDVGFSVEECRQLVQLHANPQRHSAHVKSLVLEKCAEVERRIQQLQSMNLMLLALADRCSGNEGPDCAILSELGREDDDELSQ